MGIRTNRKGGHGKLTYQEHREFLLNKAIEWMKNPNGTLCADVYVVGRNYGLKTILKEMGFYEMHKKMEKQINEEWRKRNENK